MSRAKGETALSRRKISGDIVSIRRCPAHGTPADLVGKPHLNCEVVWDGPNENSFQGYGFIAVPCSKFEIGDLVFIGLLEGKLRLGILEAPDTFRDVTTGAAIPRAVAVILGRVVQEQEWMTREQLEEREEPPVSV